MGKPSDQPLNRLVLGRPTRRSFVSSMMNLEPYVPHSFSEIYDQLGSMFLKAPTFIDKSGVLPDDDIDYVFYQLDQSFEVVRKKLGEDRYARLIALSAQAKGLFAADQGDDNGKADEGRKVLSAIEDVIQEVRSRRVKARLTDEEGEVTGD